jgi:hypothetical protein
MNQTMTPKAVIALVEAHHRLWEAQGLLADVRKHGMQHEIEHAEITVKVRLDALWLAQNWAFLHLVECAPRPRS